MKQLLSLIIIIFIFVNVNAQYITYIKGKDPIILLATHGGSQFTKTIKNRECGKHTCVTDLNTDVLVKEAESYFNELGIYPHILVMELDRKEIDLNRPLEEACNDVNCNVVYYSYHNKIKSLIKQYQNSDKVLILDIHGHSHSHALIELGYDISRLDYRRNINLISSSVNNVLSDNEFYIRGYNSLGYLLELFGYSSTPSISNPIPPKQYFNGGYITETYKTEKNVAVIQIELPFFIRKNKKERKDFLNIFSIIISYYYDNIIAEN